MTSDDLLNKNQTKLNYTAAQRRFESGSKFVSQKLRKRKPPDIQELEDKLAEVNSRSSSSISFSAYVRKRTEVEDPLYTYYENNIFRIYKWWTYCRKKRSEDKLISNIQKTFLEPDQ